MEAFAPMPSLARDLAVAVAIAQVYTLAWYLFGPQETFRGSPLFNWYSCQPIQLVVLPAICIAAFWRFAAFPAKRHGRSSLVRWIMSPWSEGPPGRPMERLFLITLIAYLAKDLFIPMDLFFWIHHIVSVATCMFAFYNDPPALVVASGMLLELGSASQAILYYCPESSFVLWAHMIVMTGSNIIAAGTCWCCVA